MRQFKVEEVVQGCVGGKWKEVERERVCGREGGEVCGREEDGGGGKTFFSNRQTYLIPHLIR